MRNLHMTLNGLNDCIQHVLGWDNTHCYIFTVHEKHYAMKLNVSWIQHHQGIARTAMQYFPTISVTHLGVLFCRQDVAI
ncbi:MAG: hypothetical protein WC749_16310, partial [Dehalococcoidia bacterium]